MITIYGITNCDTCQKARRWLDARQVDYRFHDLRQDGLTIQMLERWCARVDWEKILNKRSLTWRKIPELDRQNLSRNKALALMLDHPTLIRRPVFDAEKVTAVGFTDDGYKAILSRLSG
ncbi:MAG: arsenate reductase [Pseudomonadota bacterium]